MTMDTDRNFYINGKKIARAKEMSMMHQPLKVGPVGVIPKGHYFVYTPHYDSYDSRYNDIGWIGPDQVIGTAVTPF